MPTLEKRLRWAGILISLGLSISALTLLIVHPLSFVASLTAGCPLTLAGVALFLLAIVSNDVPRSTGNPPNL